MKINEVKKHVKSWNGRPLVLYHPKDSEGNHVSANDPEILARSGIGQVWNARVEGDKFKVDAWIDVAAAEQLGEAGRQLLDSVNSGELIEVSTAYFRDFEATPGVFNGVKYETVASNISPDHIAILPDEVGACSVQDGCGLMRENSASCGCDEDETTNNSKVMEVAKEIAAFIVQSLSGGGEEEVATNEHEEGEIMDNQTEQTEEVVDEVVTEEEETTEETTTEEASSEETEETVDEAPANELDEEVVAFARELTKSGVTVNEIIDVVKSVRAEAETRRGQLVATITANSDFTAEELEGTNVPMLEKMAANFAKPKGSYAGVAGPRTNNKNDDLSDWAPPAVVIAEKQS